MTQTGGSVPSMSHAGYDEGWSSVGLHRAPTEVYRVSVLAIRTTTHLK